MRLVVALLLNLLLALSLVWWLRREHRRAAPSLRRWLLPALGWRLLLTAIVGSRPSPDANFMVFWSKGLAVAAWAHPAGAWLLWQGQQIRSGSGQVLTKYDLSNTLFLIKILGVLNFASLGIVFLNALYLSLFCFVGCWLLARTWAQVFPATPPAAPVVALLLWPSVVWWTAGLGKETMLVGCETALVALVLRLLYGPPAATGAKRWQRLAYLTLSLLLAWLAYRMRFFFALPLLGVLVALAGLRGAAQLGWPGATSSRWQLIALLLVAGVGGGLGLRLFPNEVNFYTEQLYEQYTFGSAASVGRPHLEYPRLAPTGPSLLAHAPLAVAQVLTRPWLGESRSLFYTGVGLENLGLLLLLTLATLAVVRGRPGHLPVVVVVLLLAYFLLTATFIGLSTPNLGTMHRYRAALLPWLLLLLLQNDYARRLMRNLE